MKQTLKEQKDRIRTLIKIIEEQEFSEIGTPLPKSVQNDKDELFTYALIDYVDHLKGEGMGLDEIGEKIMSTVRAMIGAEQDNMDDEELDLGIDNPSVNFDHMFKGTTPDDLEDLSIR